MNIEQVDDILIEFPKSITSRDSANHVVGYEYFTGGIDLQICQIVKQDQVTDLIKSNFLQSLNVAIAQDDIYASMTCNSLVLDSTSARSEKRAIYGMGFADPVIFANTIPQIQTITYISPKLTLRCGKFELLVNTTPSGITIKLLHQLHGEQLDLCSILSIAQITYNISVDDILSEIDLKCICL